MKFVTTGQVKIGDIIDRETKEVKTPHRIGRICTVTYEIGNLALIKYPNGSWWTTSTVVDFEENDYGFWITTLNTLYRFDYKYNQNFKRDMNNVPFLSLLSMKYMVLY